jgi:WD40 repeat protein
MADTSSQNPPPPRVFRGHTGWVPCAAFSPDSRLLASGGTDRTVRLWSVKTGEQVRTLEHTATVMSVAFHPHLPYLLSGDWAGNVHVWNYMRGSLEAKVTPHHGPVQCITIMLDGRFVLSGSGHRTMLWVLTTGRELRQLEHPGLGELARAVPLSKRLVACVLKDMGSVWYANRDKTYDYDFFRVDVLDLEKGRWVGQWDLLRREILRRKGRDPAAIDDLMSDPYKECVELRDADISPDGNFAVLGLEKDRVFLWDLRTKMLIRKFAQETDGTLMSARCLPDNQHLMISTWNMHSGEAHTSLWNIREETRVYRTGYSTTPSTCSPDSRHVVDVDSEGGLWVRDLPNLSKP